MRVLGAAFVGLSALGSLAAQAPILDIEAAADRLARDQLEARLARVRVTVKLRSAPPRELARQLAFAAGEVTIFVVRPHAGSGDFVSLDLDVERITVLQCLALVRRLYGLRFVYAHGAVILAHAKDVKPPHFVRVYDLRAATFKLREFVAPRLDLPIGERDESPREVETENTPSGLSLERIEELIRSHIAKDSWSGEASLVASGGLLIVRQTEAAHAEIRDLLAQLGVAPPLTARPLRTAAGTPAASGSGRAARRPDGR